MAKVTKEELMAQIRSVAETWKEKPETIAEYVAFSARFYQYSARNTMAIYRQNPNATFVGSFQFWKELGYSVNKGETGLRILVPTPVTLFKRDGEEVQLKHATREEREGIKNGSIPTRQQLFYSLGNVFDIAQTTCPVELYPEIYNMGYADAEKSALVAALSEYSEKELHCPVSVEDLSSISLRGYFAPIENQIVLNDKMRDSEKLSTLAHEIGHAILHNTQDLDKTITDTQIELEADMLALMVESRLGIEVTEGRARHLASHYTAFMGEEAKKAIEEGRQGNDAFSPVIGNVYKRFEEVWGSIEQYLMPFQKKYTELTFEEQVEAVANKDVISFSNSHLYMGQTPEILGRFGFDATLPMLVTYEKMRDMLADEETYTGKGNPHGLEPTQVALLPSMIADPAIVMKSRNYPETTIVVATSGADNKKRPIIAAIKKGRGVLRMEEVDATIMASAYGKKGFATYVQRAIEDERILYVNKKNCHQIENTLGLQLPDAIFLDGNNSISNDETTVNITNMPDLPETIQENSEAKEMSDQIVAPINGQKPTITVNLFGSPGTERGTVARQLKDMLETQYKGISVAVVGDYIADLVNDGKKDMLNGSLEIQKTIYNEQHRRVQELMGKVDVVITNNPDILSTVYLQDRSEDAEAWKQQTIADFKQERNFNILLKKGVGSRSTVIDRKIENLLESNNIFYGGWRKNSEKVMSRNIYNSYIRENVKRLEKAEPRQSKLELAKSFPICDAAALIGLTVTGRGNVLSTKEHDSLKLYVNSNSYYRFSTRQGGTTIDLLVKEGGMDTTEAIDALARLAGYEQDANSAVIFKRSPADAPIETAEAQKEQANGVTMPERAENNKRVFGYLSGRGIDSSLIYEYIGRGLLYEDATKHNCVFVGRDREGNAQAGYMRGTLTYGNAFKGCATGSNKEYGVFFEGGKNKQTLVCFEAPIDMMSFQQLFGKDYSCIALGGVNGIGIGKTLEAHPEIKNIAFAFDNDAAGRSAAEALSAEYTEKGYRVKSIMPKEGKDWNEWLQIKQNAAESKKNVERKAKII